MISSQPGETQRISSVRQLNVLDTSAEPVFDGLVEVAAAVCGVPISLVSLVDTDRQWFKANLGLPGVNQTPRDVAFCNHTIQQDDYLEVCDATKDPRFSKNPLVSGDPDIRFYAGHPLRLSNGKKAGSLCVIDRVPRKLTQQQHKILAHLADAAAHALETRRLSIEMNYRATHDSLTNLANRSEFESCLSKTFLKARNKQSKYALLCIDLDQFKIVNDTCGHAIGDQLLRQVAKLLSQCVRNTDTLARLGGDEFGVILEGYTCKQARAVAEQMRKSVDEFRFIHKGQRFRIGTSIGLVPLDDRWETADAAMQAADSSCYMAKESGRNRVHRWSDSIQQLQARRDDMQWTARLEQAIDEDRFVLHAQRITPISNPTAEIHAEVLIRLVDQNGQLFHPDVFLPPAERYHLATRIDRWVLKKSIDHLLGMKDISNIAMLSINLSGQSVGDSVFRRDVIDLLTTAGSEISQRICLEITETAAVTNIADAATFVEQVRKLGVRVALDDFGAGASSFGYLKILNVDFLKIDGQFITGMIADKGSR